MSFNVNKCVMLSIKPRINTCYNMCGNRLEMVEKFCDLGVWINGNLKWLDQVKSLSSKAMKTLGLLRWVLGPYIGTECKKMAYTTFVKSITMYASPVWSPASKNEIKMLEHVQRVATRYITHNPELSYSERLQMCNMLPLTYIRDMYDTVTLFNIIHGHYDCDFDELSITLMSVPRQPEVYCKIIYWEHPNVIQSLTGIGFAQELLICGTSYLGRSEVFNTLVRQRFWIKNLKESSKSTCM